MQQVRDRVKRESAGGVETMGERGSEVRDGESSESPPSPPPKDNSPLFKRMTAVMHVVIFLYSAAFWVQTNVFPFLSKKLGADTVMFGYLETSFAFAMLVGGPLFGRLGDIFGARMALTLALVSSSAMYFTLSVADSIPLLFLSRVPGVFMHVFHGAQMVMTDVSGADDRADALGKLGVSYGLGMVVGPYVGGYLTTHYSEEVAALTAGGMCVVGISIVWLFVPKSTKRASEKEKVAKDGGSVLNVKAILSLLQIPAVALIITLKTVVGIPAGVWHSMFAMVNIERLGLTPTTNGYIMSYVGILTIFMQGFGIKLLTTRFKDNLLIKCSLATTTVCYFLLMFADSLTFLVMLMPPMIAAGAVLNVITNSAITKVVPEGDTGTALGLNMASNSVIRTFAPSMGGYLYAWLGYPCFGLLGFIMNGFTTIAVLTVLSNIQLQ